MATKPKKPTPDFPLFPHASGQWAKKIKGVTRYFGPWGDPEAAKQKYLNAKDDLHEGRKPRRAGAVTVRDVCNAIIHSKTLQADSGEITRRTVHQLTTECNRMAEFFGSETAVVDIEAADFERYRSHLASKFGPTRLAFGVGRVRQAFKYAFDTDLIDQMPKFGPLFKGPSLKAKRLHRHSKLPRMWEAGELRSIIAESDWEFQPIVLLAINCGFGPTDISRLPKNLVDIDAGWIRYPRPKTGVHRTCPLWPETVAALRVFMERGGCRGESLFTTKTGGPLVGYYPDSGTVGDAISARWRKILKRLSISRPGVGFYGIRHTFQTIAEGSRDFAAVSHIMGHAAKSDDMSAVYRESISDERLTATVEQVRNWLWPETAAPRT